MKPERLDTSPIDMPLNPSASITGKSRVSLAILWTLIGATVIVCSFLYSIKMDLAQAVAGMDEKINTTVNHADEQIADLKNSENITFVTKAQHDIDIVKLTTSIQSVADDVKASAKTEAEFNTEQRVAMQKIEDAIKLPEKQP